MYYLDRRSQKEIAVALGTTRSNVSRMLTAAQELGIVTFHISGMASRDMELENTLRQTFGLSDARVLAVGGDDIYLETSVGALAAEWLLDVLVDGQRIALSWGTMLQSVVSAVEVDRLYDVDVMQLVGSLSASASPVTGQELVRELASRLGSTHHYLHGPAVFSSSRTLQGVLTEPTVVSALELARQSDVALVGIGAFGYGSSAVILEAMNLEPLELAEFSATAPVGDICGRFFDLNGAECSKAVHDRVLAVDLADLKNIPTVVAVVSGVRKARGLLGALHGGYLNVLVCDQALAERVLRLEAFQR